MINCFHRTPQGNFGDDFNQWLWDELIPGIWKTDSYKEFYGVGSIIPSQEKNGIRRIIFSTGLGYGPTPQIQNWDLWDFFCVRGPLTSNRLGLPLDLAITDGAVLITHVYRPKPMKKKSKVSFVPHWGSSLTPLWQSYCQRVGFHYIDPKGNSREVIDEIANSEMVLTEAMHGAIIADAYRVPWRPVFTNTDISFFKWADWTLSMELPMVINFLTTPMILNRSVSDPESPRRISESILKQFAAVADQKPFLSKDIILEEKIEKLMGKVNDLKTKIQN